MSMTIDEVMKLTPEQVQRRVAELLGWNPILDNQFLYKSPTGEKYPYLPDWHTDLNDAMTLVPQGDDWADEFEEALDKVAEWGEALFLDCFEWLVILCPDKPLALCREFLLWKDGAA